VSFAKSSLGGKPGTSSTRAPSKTGIEAYGGAGQVNVAKVPGVAATGSALVLVSPSASLVVGWGPEGVVFGVVVLVACGPVVGTVEFVPGSVSDVGTETPTVAVVSIELGWVPPVAGLLSSSPLAAGGVQAAIPMAMQRNRPP